MNRRSFLQRTGASLAAGAAQMLVARAAGAAGPRPKTILLYSAWQTINIGDIGHTPGTLRIIE